VQSVRDSFVQKKWWHRDASGVAALIQVHVIIKEDGLVFHESKPVQGEHSSVVWQNDI
jgi:hypothetical protein